MLTRHAPFRILLALLLLLNVAGTAAAGAVHAAGAHGAMPPQGATADAACHDAGAAGVDHAGRPLAPAPDCCGDGDCTACTGFAHALPPPILVAAGAWTAPGSRSLPARGHAGPALARLVRPPIG